MHESKRSFVVVLAALAALLLVRTAATEAQSSTVQRTQRIVRAAAITPVAAREPEPQAEATPTEGDYGDRVAPSAVATVILDEPESIEPPAPTESVSVGRANRGRLRHGVPLRPSAVLRLKNERSAINFGTGELVGMLERAATRVAAAYPGAILNVGDLSRERGGRVRPHRSHRVGRDVDVGFYLRDADGEPVLLNRFADIGRDGKTRAPAAGLELDLARNWALVAALLSDPNVEVQYIFVADYIRERILAEAERSGAPAALLERARVVLNQPRQSPHRSHFHVRIYCPADDRPQCVDLPPFYPWVRRGTPAE